MGRRLRLRNRCSTQGRGLALTTCVRSSPAPGDLVLYRHAESSVRERGVLKVRHDLRCDDECIDWDSEPPGVSLKDCCEESLR